MKRDSATRVRHSTELFLVRLVACPTESNISAAVSAAVLHKKDILACIHSLLLCFLLDLLT